MGLGETRLAKEGTLFEQASSYAFVRKGRAKNEERIQGIGFVIKTAVMKKLSDFLVGINEQLIKLHSPWTS